jgi:hypothetical protein
MGSSVVEGDRGALDLFGDLPVEPDGGVEREQALDDAGPQPGGDPAACCSGCSSSKVINCSDSASIMAPIRVAGKR